MKKFLWCLVLAATALANDEDIAEHHDDNDFVLDPCQFYSPSAENHIVYAPNPNHTRFMYIEDDDGYIRLHDLEKDDANVTIQNATTADVTFYLYTRSNRAYPRRIANGDVAQLADTPFDAGRTNLFVTHGWKNSKDSPINQKIRDAALERYDLNYFAVDWSGLASYRWYPSSKKRVRGVGEIVGEFVNDLQAEYGLDGSKIVMVGHSLGAHVSGCAGAVIKKKVAHIVGLDPAGVFYNIHNRDEILDSSDAQFVQIIHTNGETLGFDVARGHVDYWPNGGMIQPGCGSDLLGTCSHSLAYDYFAESLGAGTEFTAWLCGDYTRFRGRECKGGLRGAMGKIEVGDRTHGSYYLKTNEAPPHAQGDNTV